MTKKLFIILFLIFSSLAFAEKVHKKKTFENWTVILYEQAKTLHIVDANGTASIPKDWVYKDEASENKPEEPKTNPLKGRKKEFVVVNCRKITVIHGNEIEDLETIYNSLNSVSDCENLNLSKLGFSTGVAKLVDKNPQTGEILYYTDLVIHKGDIEWDDE